MLVLTRRIGEEVVIAGDIRVSVVAINGHRVRLGITAPPAVPVARRELLPGYAEGDGSPAAAQNRQDQQPYPRSASEP
jgi:carbon storage regulator